MNEREVFIAALQKESSAERRAYLDAVCGGDDEFRRSVEALLAVHGRAGSFLEHPLIDPAITTDDPIQERPGTVIGPYRLMEQIGEGGFGVVFMAEQQQPIRRKVALKVLKPGMDSRQVIARFEAERQALALMDHPNIAKVLDAGATETGRPCFVMELIKGVPLTWFCDENRLAMRERLELFVHVCQAVQHAHHKGVIHRDLKPSNVLVTLHDDRPVPKVIDFGVAKAAGQSLTDKTLMTGFGAIVGTLEYMSPEQASLNNLDIDTRSDVYSLGVLLYELLTGTTPFEKERLRQAAYDEILRIIREEEAPKPSTRVSTLGEAARTVAEQRQVHPKRLSRLLRGELDWITLKALEKDRTRRYATAQELADDLRRLLNGEPILARPAGLVRRYTKWVRRRPALAAAYSLAVLALTLGGLGGGAAWLWQSAEAARLDAVAARDQAHTALRQEKQALAREANARRRLTVVSYLNKVQLANQALLNHDLSRAQVLLERCPEELRHWEWYYLHRRCQGELLTLQGHTDTVSSVVYSPDGRRLVSKGVTENLRVWDVATSREVLTIRGEKRGSVQFSNDCQQFVSCIPGGDGPDGRERDSEIKVGDLATGRERFTLKVPRSRFTLDAAFSPDGKQLAAYSSEVDVQTRRRVRGEIKVFDLATRQEKGAFKIEDSYFRALMFSPDGKRLGAAINVRDYQAKGKPLALCDFKVWDLATGQEMLTLKAGMEYVFSPDGQRLACLTEDKTVVVRNLDTREEVFTHKGQQPVSSVTFSPDGRRLAICSEVGTAGTIQFWDLATGKPVRTMKGTAGAGLRTAFSRDGKRLAIWGSPDKAIRVVDLETGQGGLTFQGHTEGISCVAFSPDGRRLATGSADQTIKVWETTGVPEPQILRISRKAFGASGVAYSPDSRRLATAGEDKMVRVRDAATGQELFHLQSDPQAYHSVAFSPDGRHLAGSAFDDAHVGIVKVWDLATRQETVTLKGHTHFVMGLAYSPDGSRLATAGFEDRTVNVWDAATGRKILTLPTSIAGGAHSVAFSPDGRRLAAPSNEKESEVKVWDLATAKVAHTLRGHTGRPKGVAFSPDGRLLASASDDRTVRLWDLASGGERAVLRGHTRGVDDVVFSADGQRLVSGSMAEMVKIWDVLTGEEAITLPAGGVTCLAFSPDDRQLAAAECQGTVKLWRVPSLPARPPGTLLAERP